MNGGYEEGLLAEIRDEITRADSKASILFSVFGLLAGAVTYTMLRDQWQPFDLSNAIEWLWWVGASLGASAITVLGRAVYPSVKHASDKGQISYYGHVVQYATKPEFIQAIADRSEARVDRMRDQIWVLSATVAKKYRCTQAAMWIFGAAVLAMVGAVGVDALLL